MKKDTIFYSWHKNETASKNEKQHLVCIAAKTWWNENHCLNVDEVLSNILEEVGCIKKSEFIYSVSMTEKDFRAALTEKELSIVKNREFNKFAGEFLDSHKLDLLEMPQPSLTREERLQVIEPKFELVEKSLNERLESDKPKQITNRLRTYVAPKSKKRGGWQKPKSKWCR